MGVGFSAWVGPTSFEVLLTACASAYVISRPELISEFLLLQSQHLLSTSFPNYRGVVLLCFRSFSTEGMDWFSASKQAETKALGLLQFAIPLTSAQTGLKMAL